MMHVEGPPPIVSIVKDSVWQDDPDLPGHDAATRLADIVGLDFDEMAGSIREQIAGSSMVGAYLGFFARMDSTASMAEMEYVWHFADRFIQSMPYRRTTECPLPSLSGRAIG